MRVKSLMVSEPITITANASVEEALRLMKTTAIRHLPVVSAENGLQGLLTLADLKEGLLPSMVSDVSLRDLIITDPVTIEPEDDIEIAARRIYRHKISGLPVVRDGKLIGIITETDILRTFIDMMGILNNSSRIEVVIGDEPDAFNTALEIIQSTGGDLINLSMTPRETGSRICHFRLSPCKTAEIKGALEAGGFSVLSTTDPC